MQKTLSGWRLFILAMMTSFAALLAVLFTPALPELTHYFNVSEGKAQTSMTLYLLGYTFGLLVYGPIAKRFGRKPALLIGLTIALMASLLAIWAGHARLFWLFCFLRFAQAFGASAGLKITFTMIADTLSGAKAARAISIITLSFVLAPAIGVAIGGGLVGYFGWEGSFLFMALYSVALLLLSSGLFETADHLDPEGLRLSHIVQALSLQFKNSYLMWHACLRGLNIAFFYLFAILGPYIGIDRIGLPPETYGLLAMIPPLGLGIGSLLNAYLVDKQPSHRLILYGILGSLVGAIAMLILFMSGILNIWALFIPMGIIEVGTGLTYPNASAAPLNQAEDKASASATLQFVSMSITFIITLIATLIPIFRQNLLPLSITFCLLCMLSIWWKLHAK